MVQLQTDTEFVIIM